MRTLSGAGCDAVSICALLWQFCEVSPGEAIPGHFRRGADEARKLAKKARKLAEDVSVFNQNQRLSSLEEEGEPWYARLTAWDARMLPDHLRRYADLMAKGIAASLRPYAKKRRWSATSRLVLLAHYVKEISGRKHHADLTNLLRIAYAVSGREKDVDDKFIKNTVERKFPSTNPLLNTEIRATARLYARLRQGKTPGLPPFILWERGN